MPDERYAVRCEEGAPGQHATNSDKAATESNGEDERTLTGRGGVGDAKPDVDVIASEPLHGAVLSIDDNGRRGAEQQRSNKQHDGERGEVWRRPF